MKRTPFSMTMIAAVSLVVAGGIALAAQDKYTVKVPGGLAFSEFRGYEGWQVVATSQNDKSGRCDPRQSRDDRRLPGWRSCQWQAFPRRLQDGEDPLDTEKEPVLPGYDDSGYPA